MIRLPDDKQTYANLELQQNFFFDERKSKNS